VKKILSRYRYSVILLRQLIKTDFKLRYQGSFLGYLWSLLRPLFMFVILYLVFTVFLPTSKDVPHKAVYLFLGIVLWNYFGEVTTGSVGAIIGKGDLLRKINFPKYVVILAVAASAFINLALNAIIVVAFMVFGHVSISWNALLIIPLLAELMILAVGLAFFLSALFVRFRDVSYIWDVLMQAGFYATPILYSLAQIAHAHHTVGRLLILNPMAQIIQDARYVLVTPTNATIHTLFPGRDWIWLVPITLSVAIAVVGSLYFRARSKHFAEEA
jgi:ABC-2 type transport system permease protein